MQFLIIFTQHSWCHWHTKENRGELLTLRPSDVNSAPPSYNIHSEQLLGSICGIARLPYDVIISYNKYKICHVMGCDSFCFRATICISRRNGGYMNDDNVIAEVNGKLCVWSTIQHVWYYGCVCIVILMWRTWHLITLCRVRKVRVWKWVHSWQFVTHPDNRKYLLGTTYNVCIKKSIIVIIYSYCSITNDKLYKTSSTLIKLFVNLFEIPTEFSHIKKPFSIYISLFMQ